MSAFARRAPPPSPLARLTAMALLLLVLLDLLCRFVVTGESPLWFHGEQRLAAWSGLAGGEGRAVFAAGFALLGLVLAALLWFRFGRLAAVLLALLAGWEVYGRARQLQQALQEDWSLGAPLLAGLAGALLLALLAILALIGTFGQARRKRWWR